MASRWACPDCGHLNRFHQWGDDGKGSYGDVCLVIGCPCPDMDEGQWERLGGPDDGALEYPQHAMTPGTPEQPEAGGTESVHA